MKRQGHNRTRQDKTRQNVTRQGTPRGNCLQQDPWLNMTKQMKGWSWEEKFQPPNQNRSKIMPKRLCFRPMKLFKNINITVQKHNFFVPRQKIDVHEQVLMKCKYVLLAFSSKTTLRPSKLVFTQEFRVEGNISVFVSKQIYCVGKNSNLPLEQVSLDMR